MVLAALEAVDYLTVFDEATPLELIQAVRPDVLVKGADYQREDVVGADFVESYGGRVHLRRAARGLLDDAAAATARRGVIGRASGAASARRDVFEHGGLTPRRSPHCHRILMNIAVFLPNWIGDAVMATPAVLRPARPLPRRPPGRRRAALRHRRLQRLRLVRRRGVPARQVRGRAAPPPPHSSCADRRRSGRPLPQLVPLRPHRLARRLQAARRLRPLRPRRTAHRRPESGARRRRQAHAQPGPRCLQPPRRCRRLPGSRPRDDAVHRRRPTRPTPIACGRAPVCSAIARSFA